MPVPVQTAAGRRNQETFTALLNAMSQPGAVQLLHGGAALTQIAAALLDLEVSAYTADETLQPCLRETGAALKPAREAQYLFFSSLDADALGAVGSAQVGSPLNPHQAATLVVSVRLNAGEGQLWSLTGPGIPGEAAIQVGAPAALLDAFLTLRERQNFPLGWDVFLIDGLQVVGLPRSTRIRVLAVA